MNAAGVIHVSVVPDNKPRTIVTRDEKKFESATITDKNEDRITISNYSGIKTILLENLPAHIQKELGYKTHEQTRKDQEDFVIAKAKFEKISAESSGPEVRLIHDPVSLPA
jgi:hypothetical protein